MQVTGVIKLLQPKEQSENNILSEETNVKQNSLEETFLLFSFLFL